MVPHRRLPHIYPQEGWLFLTWHLHGGMPRHQYPPFAKASAGQAFVWMDRQMDSARFGPLLLKQEAIAELVIESLFKGQELGQYQLGPFAVMANHVHVLLLPRIPPSKLLKSVKGFTARQANLLLGRTGEPFWQRESYDHAVRHEDDRRIADYIENNPVKTGVVDSAEKYAWSSANPRWQERSGSKRSQDCERGTPEARATRA